MALLGAVSKTWAFGYIVGDIALFLLYTLVRNDFIYFTPVESYIGSIGVSLLVRIGIKVSKGAVNVVTFYIHSLTDPLFASQRHNSSSTISQLCCK